MNQSVAVIIPTYNRISTLARALDSVYSQTRGADEICVVDDGSTDGTVDFINSNYPEVICISQKNRGVSAARNCGVLRTQSNWLAFLDSDDEWLPKKLELQFQALQENPDYRLIHSDEIWIRRGVRVNQKDRHRKTGGYIFERCLPLCVISPSSVLMTRELLGEMKGFDENLPVCEDYDLWLKICSRYPVFYVDQPLLNKYGGHEDQLSSMHWGMDRFRVQALDSLINSSFLTGEQCRMARSMLLEKCEILRNGASKRGNKEAVLYYRKLIASHSVFNQNAQQA